MATSLRYSQEGNPPLPYHALHTPVSSTDRRHLYGSGREMGPPPLDYLPQVLEIDTSSSRTLPSPSTSTPFAWEPPAFQLHGFGDLPTYSPPRQVSVESHNRGIAPNPLLHWYFDNDGPWTPSGSLSEVPKESHSRAQRGNNISLQRVNAYDPRIPSDAGACPGIPPSDSGYGTRHSDGNSSNFSIDISDRDQEGQSLVGPAAEFQQYPGIGEVSQQRDPHLYGWDASPDASVSDSQPGKDLVCPSCHKGVKTRSELKKHDLRHRKPFICQHPGCSRAEGFSTKNDLDRHLKSKHPSVLQGSESTKWYRCLVQGCKSKEKTWPRLDNFRNHLKRVHRRLLANTEEFEKMVRLAEYVAPIPCDISQDHSFTENHLLPETSLAASPTMHHIHQTLAEPSTITADWRHPYLDTAESSQDQLNSKEPPCEVLDRDSTPDELASSNDLGNKETVQPTEILQGSADTENSQPALDNIVSAPLSVEAARPTARNAGPSPEGKAQLHHAATPDATITEVIKAALAGVSLAGQGNGHTLHHPEWNASIRKSTSDGKFQSGSNTGVAPKSSDMNHIGSPVRSESSIDSEAQRKAIEVLKTLHGLGYIVQKDPSHLTRSYNPGPVASNKGENLVTCQKCMKFKGRPCELKKHMKRHSRPYGCTFPECKNKTFGSKNDWKRHENSQHIHLETWRCDEEKPEGGVCAKVCYRKQSFTDHLQKDHSMTDDNAVEKKATSCYIGRNCQARFWCGFCVKLIDLKRKSLEAWAERFDHIDDHFMGRHRLPRQCIQDWVPADSSERPKINVPTLHEVNASPGHDAQEDSSPSPDSRSLNGSPPESLYAAGASSGDAVLVAFMDNGPVDEGPKRKRADSDENRRPAKQRGRVFTGHMVVYCCQCHTYHNHKLDQSCTICDDSHRFCDNCIVEPMGAHEDRSPVDLS